MKRKSFFLPEQQIKALERIAKRKGLAVSEILRRAIEEYIERQK